MSRKTSKDKIEQPDVCLGCYRWDQWKHDCSYFWRNKSECGSKVSSHEDMLLLEQIRFK